MNRRDWMKLVVAGAPAALFYPGAAARPRDSLFIITDDPQQAIATLAGALRPVLPGMRIDQRTIAPSPQDVTIIRSGRVIDPTTDSNVDKRITDLAARLRTRRTPGTRLVSIEPRLEAQPRHIRFECDGRVVDAISADRSYSRITIPGAQGETVFSFQEGRLAVVRSSCRHELCKRTGATRSGRIICAPNRLVATVGRGSHGLDAITG